MWIPIDRKNCTVALDPIFVMAAYPIDVSAHGISQNDLVFCLVHCRKQITKRIRQENFIFIARNTTNKRIYKYVRLLYYKQPSLQHVAATY